MNVEDVTDEEYKHWKSIQTRVNRFEDMQIRLLSQIARELKELRESLSKGA
jgi:hypothetical protein